MKKITFHIFLLLSSIKLFCLDLDSILKNPGDIYIAKAIFFELDKSKILEVSYPELDSIASFLLRKTNLSIEVRNHCDSLYRAEIYSTCLTCRRAKEVADYLVAKGINKDRISHKGYNYTMPLINAETAGEFKLNRRTEFMVLRNDFVEKTTFDTLKLDTLFILRDTSTNLIQREPILLKNAKKCVLSFQGCDDRNIISDFNLLFFDFYNETNNYQIAFEKAIEKFKLKYPTTELRPILNCQ